MIEIGRPEDVYLKDPPCVTPNTLILTNNGYKRAENILAGDYVFTHKGNWKKVGVVYKRKYAGNMCNIRVKGFNFKLSLTPEHPVYAVEVEMCPWDSLLRCKPNCKKRESVYLKQNYDCKCIFKRYNPEWIESNKLTRFYYLVLPKIKDIVSNNFSEKHMYIFGLFLAEGDYNKNDAIRFNLGKHEKQLIEKIIHFMNEIYGLKPHFDYSGQGTTRILFYSRSLTAKFKKMFGCGARGKTIPFEFVFFKKEKLIILINGFVDGDGYLRKNKTEFYTSSNSLMETFRLILNKIGIIPSITESTPKDTNINGRVIRSNGTGYAFQITNKKQRDKYWEDENYFYIPIDSNIITPYDGYVFNYEVEDDNSYIANGVTLHNCL